MKHILTPLVLLLLFLTSCQSNKKKSVVKTKEVANPNIIFIMADDLGWGDVGYNGQTKIKTPNIDQLAKDGVIFNRMYAGSSVCGPSRASLITGMHTGHGTVRGNPRWTLSGSPVDIDSSEVTIAEILKKVGYRTGVVGKWGLAENLGDAVPSKQGFDYFYGFNKHLPAHHYYPEKIWENDSLIALTQNNTQKKQGDHVQELFTKKSLEFIDKDKKAPFFLYLAYTVPHFELTIPTKYKRYYESLDWPLNEMESGHYLNDKNGHVTYASMVTKMDGDIGRLIQKLKNNGQYENTLIIFTSDNGHEYDNLDNEFFNSNGIYRGKKRDLYDGGIHMPFVACWPKQIKNDRTTEHLSAFWDVKATLADLVGLPLNHTTDGISFLPTLLDKKEQKQHDYLYWEFNELQGPIQALVLGHWKLVFFVETNTYELYNLSNDPSEKENVIDEFPDVFARLKTKIAIARTESVEFPLTKRPNPWAK